MKKKIQFIICVNNSSDPSLSTVTQFPYMSMKKLVLRFQEMDEYMSDDQKKLYMYILTQDTNITEKDAYTIALRMPPNVDWEMKKTFEECVRWFQFHKANISTPAHFIKMYTKKLHAYRKTRMEKYTKNIEFKNTIDFKKFKEMLDSNS